MTRGTWLLIGPLLAASLGACDETTARDCASDAECTLPEVCGPEAECRSPDPVAEGKPCKHGEHCTSKLCLDSGKGGTCVLPCTEPSACTAGQVCLPLAGRALPATTSTAKLVCQKGGSGELFLNEACASDSECRSGLCEGSRCTQVCGTCPSVLLCEKATLARAGSSLSTGLCKDKLVETIELGAVDVSKTGATLLTFQIKSGVDSFILFADDTDDLRVAITRLEAPDGAVLVDYVTPANALMRAYDYIGTASVHVPGTDDVKAKVKPGTYRAWVQTYEKRLDVMNPVAGRVERVAVVVRRSAQKGGLLDLDLHFSPATGVTAAAAPTSAYVKASLAQLDTLFRKLLGVGVGEVRYFDLPASEDTQATADAARAVRVTYSQAGPRGLSVSLFVVKTMSFGYQAVAGGIPGVPGLAGRPTSGVVAEVQSSTTTMGRLLAHEIGHFLGLFHTTEKGAVMVDKISDTPTCPAGTAVQSCPDYQNLMFPYYLTAPDPLTLSAGQAGVVRGSPWLYETVYPEACGKGSAVVDTSKSGFASGTTTGAPSLFAGTCGGTGVGERVHLYRLKTAALKSLEVEVIAQGFDPVVYVLQGTCAASSAVLACQAGTSAAAVKLTLDSPKVGAYFLIVDGKSAGGTYSLAVREVPKT